MEEYKVIGPFEIAGKATGETVQLDPDETNIQALIDGGHIEPIKTRKAQVESAKDTG